MSNAKQLAYALIDALNACGIEEEFSYRFLAEMNDLLKKENKKMELENEAKMVAGHNKELQQQIITLMKDYGITAVEALELIDKLSKPKVKVEADLTNNIGDIADVMQDVYTSGNITGVYDEDNKPPFVPVFASGEDPGDTHDPSKGSGKIDYDELINTIETIYTVQDMCFLDYQEHLQLIEIIKYHREQNAPVKYGTPKDIGNGEYAAVINPVPKYKPEPFNMYADGQTPKLFDVEHEGRAYQEMQFKDFNITFMQGDEVIKSTDIHEALQYVYLLCEGYMAHIDKRRYRMKEILMKQYPSHEVIVKVEEVKRYG